MQPSDSTSRGTTARADTTASSCTAKVRLSCSSNRTRAAKASVSGAIALAVFLATACQSYSPRPLELDARMDAIRARLADVSAHGRFVEQLSESGQQPPARLELSDGVTLAEGEVLALFYNANLRVARLKAGVALARFENAGLWQDPVFGFDAAQVLSPGNDLEYGATLGLTLPVSGRLAVAKTRAGAAYEVELKRIVDAEWSLRIAVRQAWYEWTAAERRRELLERVIEQVERIRAIAGQLAEAGAIREADERLLRIELVGRRAELTAAELASQQVRVRLLWMMGLPPDSALALQTTQELPSLPEDTDLVERVLHSNTQLAVLRSKFNVTEEALRLAVRKQYPDIGFGAGYGSEDDDSRFLFGFSLPIPLLNRNRAEIAAAGAQREVARAAVETALERIVREARETELVLRAARIQRAQFVDELLPLLDEQATNVEELAELGDVDTFLLLETVGRQFNAQSRLIELEQAESESIAGLAFLLGPSTLPSPTTTDDISLPPPGH